MYGLQERQGLENLLKHRYVESFVGLHTAIEIRLVDGRVLEGRVHNPMLDTPNRIMFYDYKTAEMIAVNINEISKVFVSEQRLQMPQKTLNMSFKELGIESGQPHILHTTTRVDLLKILQSGFLGLPGEKSFLSTFSNNKSKDFVSPTLIFDTSILDTYPYRDTGSNGFYIGRFNKYGNHHAQDPKAYFYSGTSNEIVFNEQLPLNLLHHIQVPKGEKARYLELVADLPCPVPGKSWDKLLVEGSRASSE